MVLGNYAAVIYSSEKYLEAGIVTSVFAFRTIIWAIELILGKQIIFINDHENRLTAFYFIGGDANILLNSLLYFNNIFAPEYYIATTIIAETVVVLLEIYFIKKHHLLDLKEIFTTLTRYTIVSLGFIPIYFAFKFLFPNQLLYSQPQYDTHGSLDCCNLWNLLSLDTFYHKR